MHCANGTNATKSCTDVNREIAVTFSALSGSGLLFLVVITICYRCCKKKITWFNRRQCSSFMFILVGILSFLGIALIQDEIVYFGMAMACLWTSTIYIFFGSFVFFTNPKDEDEIPKERHDSHLLPFILGITAVIIVQESLYFIGSFSDKESKMKCALFATAAIQKFVQITTYHFKLTDSIPKGERNHFHGASWYYKTIALINFIFWIESIKVTKDRQQEIYMDKMLHGVYTVFARTYTALIVDYRLICCILFAEHAFAIDEEVAHGIQQGLNDSQTEV